MKTSAERVKWVEIQPEASREGTSWTEWRVRWIGGEVISCGLKGISHSLQKNQDYE